MPGRIIKHVPMPCSCEDIPDSRLYGNGTEWQCDCGTVHVRAYDQKDGAHWQRQVKSQPQFEPFKPGKFDQGQR
jgi:hypothetical protein